ncbi:coiled-coil domain-containing protein 124-like [Octopus sinensis]|uniref:Coiled-coil domain-containing protein 124-like n=1 Tax=Octopus sinensis TaxID=2607531 RepID=A0A6P7TU85_9MOLL|nr:coiled-coil domain-containing protein 124-like [Octopus sinensis]
MKLAFREFEEARLPELRKEFPKMRYKQHLKMIRDEFEKSDVNPMNKPHMSYNAPDERKVKVLEKKLEKLSLETGCENHQE